MDKMIVHVDGDSFFAACEMSRHPHLWGKPVVVGQERGIACAMSTAAKKLGITRAMPIFQIREQFKEVIVLSSHFDLYEMYSMKLFKVLSEYFDHVEHYSIDECFAEARPEQATFEYLSMVKADVQRRLGITFSFGAATTKVLAKVASKHHKPDGLTIITPGTEDTYLETLSVGSLWGIGYRTAEKLRSMNIQTALDFKYYRTGDIQDIFSEPIARVQSELNGKACGDVNDDHEDQKSIQSTRSFSPATSNATYLHSEISHHIEDVCERLRAAGMYAKFVSLFIKSKVTPAQPLRKVFSLSKELNSYTNSPVDLLRAIRDEFPDIIDRRYMYKATGVTVHGLRHKEFIPQDLLGIQDESFEINTYVDTIDAIHKRFGDHCIQVASSLGAHERRHREGTARDAKEPYLWNLPLPYLGRVS